MTVFGQSLGPGELAGAALDGNGSLATSIAGTRVLFDGVPAPIVYVSGTQNSVVVPYEVAGRSSTNVTVESGGRTSAAYTVRVNGLIRDCFRRTKPERGRAPFTTKTGRQIARPTRPPEALLSLSTGPVKGRPFLPV